MTRIAGLKPCATGAPFVAQPWATDAPFVAQPFRAARKAGQPFTAAAILLASLGQTLARAESQPTGSFACRVIRFFEPCPDLEEPGPEDWALWEHELAPAAVS